MNFNILRLVAVVFDAQLKDWCKWNATWQGVVVKPTGDPCYDPKTRKTLLVLVGQRLVTSPFEVDGNQAMLIPSTIRRELEEAIEHFVDILAVVTRCKRSLWSPNPYIAVEPLDDEAKEWIRSVRCIYLPLPGIPPRMYHDMGIEQAMTYLGDRLDGVALIAEALCHEHPTGRVHELIRLFERAFATAAGKVCKQLLPQFLHSIGEGFTDSEIRRWLDLRDRSAHADRRREFALEADTRPVANRMEQAAYDVLFNKLVWHDPSLERRSVFGPVCGSMSGDNCDLFLKQGKDMQIDIETVDGFGAYYYNLNLSLTTTPETWFTRTSNEQRPDEGKTVA